MHQLFNKVNLIQLFIFWFPIAFLSIRHGVHVALYGLFLIFIYELIQDFKKPFINKRIGLIFLSLSSLFIATLLQQLISQDLSLRSFDGPSRLLFAGIVFIYLCQRDINYIKLIEISTPLGLILLCVYLYFHTDHFWGHRWANSFVDPNSLGSQATILALICLLTLNNKSHVCVNILKVLGAAFGIYLSIKAESRGGWATLPFMILTWLVIQIKSNKSQPNQLAKHFLIITSVLISFIIAAGCLMIFNQTINNRLSQIVYEISTWFIDPLIYTSAGSRMSMWVTSFHLIMENWVGYGELEIKQVAANHSQYSGIHQHGFKDLIQAGPHSDFLSKGLSFGLLGIVSYLALIFIPFLLFFKNTDARNHDIKKAASIGLLYTTGVFIAGLFNEALSLKYLCSFYGLMIACLAAQILRDNSRECN